MDLEKQQTFKTGYVAAILLVRGLLARKMVEILLVNT